MCQHCFGMRLKRTGPCCWFLKKKVRQRSIDFCLTPGLVFDKKLNRLGRGGANYDQFIKAHPHTYYLGVCFTCQIFPTLAIEKHDQKVDALISETLCFP